MKISHKNILALGTILSMFTGNNAQAGGSMGGGGPPARENLIEQLMQAKPGAGGLYTTTEGSLGLGINSDLTPDLTVTRSYPGSGIPLSDSDFSKLKSFSGNIDVESVAAFGDLVDPITGLPSTLRSSYKVEDGNTIDTLQLKDRRFLIRNGVDNTVDPATK
jgi:hypothetical protein